ncbi:uncharacterized protein LOC123296908 [Chrysoperla carnea]|uniref:uncharacterized protein LOC123296908 n=1 Tax=Chrysoperla carnea TaxID=189513 RepID=UPI001D081462|nr:uncharacterized protein LOC123296908 [Chrysoperla carnea]
MKCSAHCDFMKCTEIVEINKLLDEEFQFMLHLAMPLWRNWPLMKDRKRAGLWIQTLCTLHYNCFCTNMRVIRNDYLMALLGYLYSKNLSGPFKLKPPNDTLYPLETMAIEYLNNVRSNALNPDGQLLNEFLVDQPLPEDGGAFCFFAITGQILRGGQRKTSKSCSCPCSDFRI